MRDGNSPVTNEVPADALEALARRLYPALLAYYESEEGQREFAEWQAARVQESKPEGGGLAEADELSVTVDAA